MAYINKEQAKEIRNDLKKHFPANKGWKFSVTIHNYMSLRVAIMEAPIDFLADADSYAQEKGHRSYNAFHLQNYMHSELLEQIKMLANKNNYDNSDIMTDYFDVGYYFDLHIGKWDKPFVLTTTK